MEKVYQVFDEQSIEDNTGATKALVKSGLELVPIADSQVQRWRLIVGESNRKAAARGLLSADLLAELEAHLAEYRSSRAGSSH